MHYPCVVVTIGTTAEALDSFKKSDLDGIVEKAVRAAHRRSRELAKL